MSDTMSLRVLVRDIKPFNAGIIGFTAMLLLGLAVLIVAILGLTKVNAAAHKANVQQVKALLQGQAHCTAQHAIGAANVAGLEVKVHSFHNFQYAAIVLSAIVILLSIWGFIVSGKVVYDYYNNNGVTEGDVNMISSMGSFIFIQMVLLLAIAIMMTVEYTKLRKALPLAQNISPVEKHMSDYSLVQLICGYIGVLGGIVIGSIMRTSRPDKKA